MFLLLCALVNGKVQKFGFRDNFKPVPRGKWRLSLFSKLKCPSCRKWESEFDWLAEVFADSDVIELYSVNCDIHKTHCLTSQKAYGVPRLVLSRRSNTGFGSVTFVYNGERNARAILAFVEERMEVRVTDPPVFFERERSIRSLRQHVYVGNCVAVWLPNGPAPVSSRMILDAARHDEEFHAISLRKKDVDAFTTQLYRPDNVPAMIIVNLAGSFEVPLNVSLSEAQEHMLRACSLGRNLLRGHVARLFSDRKTESLPTIAGLLSFSDEAVSLVRSLSHRPINELRRLWRNMTSNLKLLANLDEKNAMKVRQRIVLLRGLIQMKATDYTYDHRDDWREDL